MTTYILEAPPRNAPHREAHLARLCTWLRANGIDADLVPERCPVVVDTDAGTITFVTSETHTVELVTTLPRALDDTLARDAE